MIYIISGTKGSGKTKTMIDDANKCGEESSGEVIFITDTKRYSLDIKYMIRLIDVRDLEIKGYETFVGMIKGLIAGNYDITDIYIDGLARILEMDIKAMQPFYEFLEYISKKEEIKFTITVSSDDLPEYMEKYPKISSN